MNHQPVPEPRPKGRGCFFYGCLTLVILFLAAMVAGYFAVRGAVNAFVAHYTDAEPMELPETVLTPAESEALDQRLAAFKDGVENPDAVPALVLDAREINALLLRHPELKGKVLLSLEDDQVKGKLSLPLDEFKAPIIGRWLRGRYLNGSATLRASMTNGMLVVTLQSVEVKGRPIPADVLTALQSQNLAEGFYRDPKTAATMSRWDSFQIKDAKVTIKPKAKE
jgi:hypothetical protein